MIKPLDVEWVTSYAAPDIARLTLTDKATKISVNTLIPASQSYLYYVTKLMQRLQEKVNKK